MLTVLDLFQLFFFVILNCLVFFQASQGPNPVGARRVEPEGWKGGAPKGGAPKGGAQNFALFSLSAAKFVLFFPLWGSSRGILVVFGVPGRSNVHVWSSVVVV